MRILLKALKKTFTSATLVGFIQYLILGFLISLIITVIFKTLLLWSGYLFLFLCIFLDRLVLVSKDIDEEEGDKPFLSEEEIDKGKTTLLSRVLKKTFSSRIKFVTILIFSFYVTVQLGYLSVFYIGVPLLLSSLYLINLVFSFLFDESGFIHPSLGSSDSIIGGDGGGGDGGGE